MHLQSLKLICATAYEEMHLQEIFDLTLTQRLMKHCPLHHVTYVPAKFEIARANGKGDTFTRLEDLKVLRPSPDLLNNVKIGQGQLQLIMEQILLYHIVGLQKFWSSDLNNLMNNPSNSPVISEKQSLDRCVAVQMSGLG